MLTNTQATEVRQVEVRVHTIEFAQLHLIHVSKIALANLANAVLAGQICWSFGKL